MNEAAQLADQIALDDQSAFNDREWQLIVTALRSFAYPDTPRPEGEAISPRALLELRFWLDNREEDIANNIEDFGNLRYVFERVVGREASLAPQSSEEK